MAEVVVFVGPSLPHTEARGLLPAAQLTGPAARGDVYRAACSGARAIALIDGVFDQRRAVLHKEVLWALSRGVLVYGAASMGALRSVELGRYGMRGGGRVYQLYGAGLIDGDDEVAVAHASADEGHRPLSLALVDLRATLDRAVERGACGAYAATHVLASMRAKFYPDRTRAQLLAVVAELEPNERESLTRHLAEREHWESVKAADARDLLVHLAQVAAQGTWPAAPHSFAFPVTAAWERLRAQFERGA
jgi:hypothetical protein